MLKFETVQDLNDAVGMDVYVSDNGEVTKTTIECFQIEDGGLHLGIDGVLYPEDEIDVMVFDNENDALKTLNPSMLN